MTVALITGGTSGIGAAFARAYAAKGMDLILVARDEKRLADAAELFRGQGREVEVIVADLGDAADTERVAARLADPERPVEILVNNAGFGIHARLVGGDVAEHENAINVMVRAPLVLSASASVGMKERGSGAIVNVASVAGQLNLSAYSAIKAWMTVFSESLANDLYGTGVTVTALLPGWVRTEFHSRANIRTGSIPASLWLDADDLVAACLRDVEKGKPISLPSTRYRILSWGLRHMPRSAVRSVSRRINRSRRDTLSQ